MNYILDAGPKIERGAVRFALGADWTPAAGDVKAIEDGGAAANAGTLCTPGRAMITEYAISNPRLGRRTYAGRDL